MFNQIDEELDLASLAYTYVTSNNITQLDTLPEHNYDVVVALAPNDTFSVQGPFRYDHELHGKYLEDMSALFARLENLVSKTSTLFVYGLPQWLPYFSMQLENFGWTFKYWIALETHHPRETSIPMVQTHEGILLYVRNKTKFNLRKVRSPHLKCDVCGDYTADWGGKKHMRHPYGYAISDVWDDLHSVRDTEHILSKHVWQRLILLTAQNNSNVLCLNYDGEQDLDQFILE